NPIREADYNGKQSGDVNEIGMAMMWDRMGQELSAIWTGIFGGSAYISPRSNRVDISPPRGGVGGVTGGVIRAATFRAVPIEDHPTQTSLVGMEMGAGLVPVADPAARLVCGTTVTGQDTSRVRAAVELTLVLAPLVAEARAATRPATIATREAAVVTRAARVAEEVATVERAAAAEATVGGRSRAPAPPDP